MQRAVQHCYNEHHRRLNARCWHSTHRIVMGPSLQQAVQNCLLDHLCNKLFSIVSMTIIGAARILRHWCRSRMTPQRATLCREAPGSASYSAGSQGATCCRHWLSVWLPHFAVCVSVPGPCHRLSQLGWQARCLCLLACRHLWLANGPPVASVLLFPPQSR